MKVGLAGSITRYFITSPLTPLFLLASLIVGIVALVTLPREEEPQISVPMVDIHVQANGLKAEDAVKLVTEPLETIIKSIDGVEHVYSQTRDDSTMVTARFLVGTSGDSAILRVHEKLRANMERIPVGIPEPLIVGRSIDDVAIVALTLSPKPEAAARWTANGLTRVARELQVEMSKIDDVGLTYIVGAQPEQIRIAPDPEKLSLYGVTLQQLSQKLRGENSSFEAGQLRDNGSQITLKAGQTLQSPAEIANVLISARDGRPVYVRDVATVSLDSSSSEQSVQQVERTATGTIALPAVSLAIAKKPGTNAVVIAQRIVDRLQQLNGTLIPSDLRTEVTRNFGETANEKANELLFHLGLATISIVFLVILSIGWREGLVVAIVIPVTILLTLFAAHIMGYTLNRVSLFALIFSIGILVDDAIVVIENISRHWAMGNGRSRVQSAIDAVAEVGNPTVVATLTVVAALLPMLFVSGMMGPYMSPIPANASAAMIFSFFVAVVVTPWLMMKFGSGHASHAHGGTPGGIFGRVYISVARHVLKSRARSWIFLLLTGVATLASLILFYTRDVTVKLLPFDNKSELQVVVDLPEGSSVEATSRVLGQAATVAYTLPEVVSVQANSGTAAPFNFNGLVRHYYLRQSPEMGDLQIKLADKKERSRSSHDVALELRQKLKSLALPNDTSVKVVEPPPGPPVMSTMLAEVYGPDADTRRQTAEKLKQALRQVPYVVDIDDSYGLRAPRKTIQLDQDSMEFHKVEEGDVYDTIRSLYSDNTVGYSHRGGGRLPIPIVVGPQKSSRVINEKMLTTPVPANALPGERTIVELGDVVRVGTEQTSYPIFRHNGHTIEMVQAELAGAFEAPVYGMIDAGRALDKLDWGTLPKPEIGLHGQPIDDTKALLLWDGEWEVTWVTFRDMGAAFMVALLGIYILVVAQFRSFKVPLMILVPIPLTLIGIMLGHWLLGAAFTATSMIGFIALAGIIVRNSILLVDFIKHLRTENRPLPEILLEAGAIRFKPIVLTAVAAMIGAVVILADPIFQGLAISLLFGLASSTALTVIVIPAIYMALRHRPEAVPAAHPGITQKE